MPRIPLLPETRVDRDPAVDAIRSWFSPSGNEVAKTPFNAQNVAREVLSDNADLFRWSRDLRDLMDRTVLTGQGSYSVRLDQEFKGVPVDSSEVVVNVYTDGRVHSIYNNYHYDIPDNLDPKNIKVQEAEAREAVERLTDGFERRMISKPRLIVYRYQRDDNRPPKPAPHQIDFHRRIAAIREAAAGEAPKQGQHYLAWDFTMTARDPTQSWRILIDANTGRLINAIDLLQYAVAGAAIQPKGILKASGTGKVFDPNPIVTSGNTGLSSGTPIGTLDMQQVPVTLDRLNAPVGADYHLDGAYARMEEIENPVFNEPTSTTADFTYPSNNRSFLDTMCYFHLDRFQNFIQTDLAMNNVANFSIATDPQGFNGADNSRYDPSAKNLAFGEGGIPDAADAMVILHEYGHAIQDNVNPGFSNYSAGISEGFGDFLAAVFYDDKHANSATRGIMMSWDANPTDGFWTGRRYDVPWLFDGPEFAAANGHNRGQLWCATMFELYRKLGGDSGYTGVKRAARDLAIRLHLMANFNVPTSGASASQMGQQVEAADTNLTGWRYANGLHKKVIYDTFRRRHLPGYTDLGVDVYINDGREGGYGSASGNDLFTEQLWDENYWDTQDIWVRTTQYGSAAAQAAGTSADHVEPPVGSTAYLYVRVKNRGTNAAGSGALTVKAFHCTPGLGLVWPTDWTAMDTPSIAVANILPGPGNGQVVGPFPWTPTEVGHECVLVVVECANDRAVTQDLLATDLVPHSDLVPFDNNIAQRNLVPTGPKGSMARGFYISNPFAEARTLQLHFNSTLPERWRWHTNLANEREVRLKPRERRWVNLVIDQASGAPVERFDQQYRLDVTGTIDDRIIGGMTYYVAPPSAFGGAIEPTEHDGPTHITGRDLFCLNIPWKECEVEGEIELKLRFRKK